MRAPTPTSRLVLRRNDDPHSLLSYYRNWIAARKRDRALLAGDVTPLDAGAQVLAYVRDSGDERALVMHNVTGLSVTVTAPVAAQSLDLIQADGGVNASGLRVTLPPHTSGAWRLR